MGAAVLAAAFNPIRKLLFLNERSFCDIFYSLSARSSRSQVSSKGWDRDNRSAESRKMAKNRSIFSEVTSFLLHSGTGIDFQRWTRYSKYFNKWHRLFGCARGSTASLRRNFHLGCCLLISEQQQLAEIDIVDVATSVFALKIIARKIDYGILIRKLW